MAFVLQFKCTKFVHRTEFGLNSPVHIPIKKNTAFGFVYGLNEIRRNFYVQGH